MRADDDGTSEGGTVEKVVGGNPNGTLWVPGECDVPVRNHDWFWKAGGEQKLYSLEQLVQMYTNSIGHKRIQPVARTEVSKVRLLTSASVAEPQIRQLAAFNTD